MAVVFDEECSNYVYTKRYAYELGLLSIKTSQIPYSKWLFWNFRRRAKFRHKVMEEAMLAIHFELQGNIDMVNQIKGQSLNPFL